MFPQLIPLVENRRFQLAIMALIVLNAITLGLETWPAAMAQAGPVIVALDRIALTIFTIEVLLRLLAHGTKFFRDPWSVFDFVVVGIALVPASEGFAVLRALRVLRVLRLISAVPRMRMVVEALLSAIPGISVDRRHCWLILFYVSAVMATGLFGEGFPEWFGTIGEIDVQPVPDHDAGELVDGHRPTGDGGLPLGVGLLRAIHPDRHLHHAQSVHRDHRQRDAVTARG